MDGVGCWWMVEGQWVVVGLRLGRMGCWSRERELGGKGDLGIYMLNEVNFQLGR